MTRVVMIRLLHILLLAAVWCVAVSLEARQGVDGAGNVADCSKGSGDTAIRECTRIIKSGLRYRKPISKKHLAKTYNSRGAAYAEKGEVDRAIADYDMAIGINPKNAYAYYNRGNAYDAKGQTARAIADYDVTVKLNPNYASVYGKRGLAYEKLGQRGKAIADFRNVIALQPGDVRATRHLKRLGVTP